MKKFIFPLVVSAGLLATTLTATGCTGSRQTAATNYDSVTIVKADKIDSVIIRATYPVGGDSLFTHSVMEYVSEQLGGSYEGSYDSARAELQHYADAYYGEMQADAKEAREAGGNPMPEFRQYDLKKVYETDKLVTFVLDYYIFNGGAHGYGVTQGFSVRKSDGRVMGFNMLNTLSRSPETARLWDRTIKQGLMKAWGFKSEDELMQMIFSSYEGIIPMPQYPPYFTKDGLVIVYQSDEIAAHAAGKAEIVIPYDKVKDFLNVTGKNLL